MSVDALSQSISPVATPAFDAKIDESTAKTSNVFARALRNVTSLFSRSEKTAKISKEVTEINTNFSDTEEVSAETVSKKSKAWSAIKSTSAKVSHVALTPIKFVGKVFKFAGKAVWTVVKLPVTGPMFLGRKIANKFHKQQEKTAEVEEEHFSEVELEERHISEDEEVSFSEDSYTE